MPKKKEGQSPQDMLPRDAVSGKFEYQKPHFGSFSQKYEQPKDREAEKRKSIPHIKISNLKV